jgi:hypothetical protein
VRGGDLEQYRKLAEHATTTGQQRVAVVYADIPFGTAGLPPSNPCFAANPSRSSPGSPCPWAARPTSPAPSKP